MSDKDKSESELATETEAAPAEPALEPAADGNGEPAEPESAQSAPGTVDAPDSTAAAGKPARAANGGGGIAWIALFLALASMALLGYSFVSDWRAGRSATASDAALAGAVAALGDRIESSAGELEALQLELADLEARNAAARSELEALQRDVEMRLTLMDSLPPRMSDLENSVAALQGVSAGARDTWLLAEAEYFMQIANTQLQLAGNPELAALALGMADERITQIGDPGLTDVRRALADELAALEGMGRPDIEGVTLTLASLARVVGSLPLDSQEPEAAGAAAAPDPEAGALGRAWNSVKTAFSNLVRVTTPDEGARPLLAPQSAYFLRTNLTLQLQAARLALLRGEQAVFEQSLEDAADWLEEYFDTDSTPVASALATINELNEDLFNVSPPDISGSLRLLRQYRTLTESVQ
jgi:uroporphyrin-3 C-methyltransferase